MFPNPAQNAFSIQNNTKQSLKSVTLTDMTGRVVFSQSLNNLPSEIIDVSSLQDGAYLLAIESEQGVIIKQLSLVR
ncbi:MAG TPA: T9SS type A sorting domain-containing protein [Edaphocola sp.]|nr:T9SS type A sorting domain-containing protein [Edaphocola sp.]